jgi:hypothetical protein
MPRQAKRIWQAPRLWTWATSPSVLSVVVSDHGAFLATVDAYAVQRRPPGRQANLMAEVSFVISVIGVCIAVGSYFRGGRQWRRSGPELGFDLSLTGYRHPGTNAVYRVVARVEIFAAGRMAVHLRSAELRGPGSSWVRTDIANSGTVKLEPTEAVLSNGILFDVPGGQCPSHAQSGIRRWPCCE